MITEKKFNFSKRNEIKIIIIIILIILYYILNSNNLKNNTKKDVKQKYFILNENSILYNNKTKNEDKEFLKYQSILPHLTPYFNDTILSMEEIFKSRQIYISDARITPEFIRYIRPINETEEEKYKKRYSENITIIDRNLFGKRPDQYNYIEFCKLTLDEKLIYKQKKENYDKPIISIVLPAYNKQNILLKSIRSIQNQNFENIEIIIVNDGSNDNSSNIFNFLLETDSRIRIFHHITNLGLYRSRLDGILYSRGKYIIAFDTGDLYEDNYVLQDAYNIIEKYNLDSCKFLFRVITSFSNLSRTIKIFHVGLKAKIEYGPKNIKALNFKVFPHMGNIWNRLVRANIYIKGLLLFNELTLNLYKNMWDDKWYNEIIHKVSYSYAIFERIGYVYCQDGQGEGTPKFTTPKQKSNIIREYVGFLYFDYNFCQDSICKASIIKKLRKYNGTDNRLQLKNFRTHFEVLNNFLEVLIKDSEINDDDRKYCKNLLLESKIREKEVNKEK